MKIIKRVWLPDVVMTMFTMLLLFLTVWGWPESGRSFLECIAAFLVGVSIGKIGILLDRSVSKRYCEEKLSRDKRISFLRVAGGLFVMMGFITNYVPVYAKYWIFSFLCGFIGELVYTMIKNEFTGKKRYGWQDLKN
jgi:hypothetical protein